MSVQLKKRLIGLIGIYNTAAKLSLYDTSPYVINTLEMAYRKLEPYKEYWTEVNPKIGVITLNKK